MRVFNFEFGFTEFFNDRPVYRLRVFTSHCGCLAFEFGRFYLTRLRGDCANPQIVYCEENKLDDDESSKST